MSIEYYKEQQRAFRLIKNTIKNIEEIPVAALLILIMEQYAVSEKFILKKLDLLIDFGSIKIEKKIIKNLEVKR